MNVIKKIIRFPWVVLKAFWAVLKYIWSRRKQLFVPFLLAELTYWSPLVAVGILSIIFNTYIWFASFYGIYVGLLPAIPIQILLTFGYYALFLRIKGKGTSKLKAEATQLIQQVKEIT